MIAAAGGFISQLILGRGGPRNFSFVRANLPSLNDWGREASAALAAAAAREDSWDGLKASPSAIN